eukprot:4905566-Alexandrium_andersonii.AAC.1
MGGRALRREGRSFCAPPALTSGAPRRWLGAAPPPLRGASQDSRLSSLSNVALEAALQRGLSQLRAE